MVVQVDNTKINKQNGLNGANSGQSTPYMTATQKHFANGGSIFNAPGVAKQQQSETTKAQSGSLVDQALNGTGLASSGSKDSETTIAGAQKDISEVSALQGKFQAKAQAGVGVINQKGQSLVTLNQQATQSDKDIQDLTSQRDAAQAEAESTDASGNPFDGTGAGATSANNVSQIGAEAPQQVDGNKTGINASVKRSGVDRSADAPASTGAAPAKTTTQGSGNSEAQAKVEDLNSKLENKTSQREQAEQKRQSAIASLKSSYNSQIAPLKASGKALDQKTTAATNKIQDAQADQQKASTVTTIGGTTTAAGSAMCSNPVTAGFGAYMVGIGGTATVGGGLWNLKAKSAEVSANNEKSAVAATKGNLISQEKLVVASYAKAINKARQA